jgi:hypothetical protein
VSPHPSKPPLQAPSAALPCSSTADVPLTLA